ncbi:hypothetical protein WDW37_12635 [Bdellovibrionota bacterium FG-1]
MSLLTSENYEKGFLVDEELMAGVTENPEESGTYLAYVLRHTTGEYLGTKVCTTLDEALGLIAQIPRDWAFELAHACKGGGCGGGGHCHDKTEGETEGGCHSHSH